MGGQEDGLGGLQDAQQHPVEVLPVEHVVAGKGLVHKNVVRPLAQGQNHLKLVLLSGGEAAQGPLFRQAEEVHQHLEAAGPEGGEVFGAEVPVPGGSEAGEEGMLTGGEGEAGDVFGGDGLPVQSNRPEPVPEQAQNALEQGGLARAVGAEDTHDLPGPHRQAHILQGLLTAPVLFGYMAHFKHGCLQSSPAAGLPRAPGAGGPQVSGGNSTVRTAG